MISPSINATLGQYGAQVATGDGTTELTPDTGYAFGSIQFVTSGTLSAITARGWSGTITGKTFAADARINGLFTSVTPASGVVVIAYKIPYKS
jgi:hypothetical protein